MRFDGETACGLRLAACGLRFTAYGLRLTAYGLRLTAYGKGVLVVLPARPTPAPRKPGGAGAANHVLGRGPAPRAKGSARGTPQAKPARSATRLSDSGKSAARLSGRGRACERGLGGAEKPGDAGAGVPIAVQIESCGWIGHDAGRESRRFSGQRSWRTPKVPGGGKANRETRSGTAKRTREEATPG